MALTADITGEHPKTVVIVSDDKHAENAEVPDKLREAGWEDLADRWDDTPFENGELRFKLEPDEIGEFLDFLEFEFAGTEAYSDLNKMVTEARADAQRKLEQEG